MINYLHSFLSNLISQFSRLKIALVVIFICLSGNLVVADTKQPVKPIVIQIAYIYNFMKFVEWPLGFTPDTEKPYTLCTALQNSDPDYFQPISKKQVRDQPVSVKFKDLGDDFSECHLLFISGYNKDQTYMILSKLDDQPTLTIGTSDDFLDLGGMIQFRVSLGQVTFSVNLKAVSQADLSISANMLDVAERVRQ